ncbi:hypothetical protein RNJ44_00276 [Nakaseomyces bracarensis]|uniref:Uncharacterized protein n=1 Tax=Nakaseomyces bracarensis TaxID=273131 RepID=A0ABR4NTM2_9SACH
MSDQLQRLFIPYWRAFRTRPKFTKQRYKPTMKYIRDNTYSEKLDELAKIEDGKGYPTVTQMMDTKSVDNLKLSELRSLLIKDMKCGPGAVIQLRNTKMLHIDNETNKKNWKKLAPLLLHPLLPSMKFIKQDHDDTRFEYEYKVRVSTTSTKIELDDVSWPSIDISNECRGIGITKDAFPEINDYQLTSIRAVNPFNQEKLPIIRVDFIPSNDDHPIGLFPLRDAKHKAAFGDDPLTTASIIIPANRFIIPEHLDLKQIIVNTKWVDVPTNDENTYQDCFESIYFRDLIRQSRDIRYLWTDSKQMIDMCPSDIIRASIFNPNFDNVTLFKEYLSHYLTHSVLRKIERMLKQWNKTNEVVHTLNEHTDTWEPWDMHMIKQYRNLENSFRKLDTSSATELTLYKHDLERFFDQLYTYCQIIESEVKRNSELFYSNTSTNHSRATVVIGLLNVIFRKSQMYSIFYNRIFDLFYEKITTDKVMIRDDILDVKKFEKQSLEMGEYMFKLTDRILVFENMMYKNIIGRTKDLKTSSTLKNDTQNFTLFITTSKPLPNEITDILEQLTKIKVKFVSSVQDIAIPDLSECIDKKVLPELDIKMYLYQSRPNTPKKVDPLISNILQKLRSVA